MYGRQTAIRIALVAVFLNFSESVFCGDRSHIANKHVKKRSADKLTSFYF